MIILREPQRIGILNQKIAFDPGLTVFVAIAMALALYQPNEGFLLGWDDAYVLGLFAILFGVPAIIAIVKKSRAEIIFHDGFLSVYHFNGSSARLIYKNITKHDIASFDLKKHASTGNVLTVLLKDGFRFHTRNQFFNAGTAPAEDVIAFLKEQMAGTDCEISVT